MKRSRRLGGILFGAVTIVASLSVNAAFVITGGAPQPLPVTGNNFNSDLQGLGYSQMTSGGQLRVDQDGFVTYTYIGAESSFNNSFNTPSGSMVENDEAFNISGYDTISNVSVSANDILNFNFTSDGGANALTPVDNYSFTNLQGLGIFTGASSQQVILGYDDQASSPDDNHDDMMILVSFSTVPVPVPAGIWLFGSGLLGLVGLARRKKAS